MTTNALGLTIRDVHLHSNRISIVRMAPPEYGGAILLPVLLSS